MKKLFREYTFTWQEVSIFKISLVSFGISVGAIWHSFWLEYIYIMLLITLLTGVYISYKLLK
jgi:hypothetical protein